MDGAVIAALAGIVGAGWGYASDRIAARWPEHEDGSTRAHDWRTILVVIAGALSFAATVARFSTDPVALLFIGVYVVALVLLFATDLDQKLLPDVITLPLVGLAALAWVTGAGPFVRTTDDLLWAAAAAVIVPLALYMLAIPFGAGAIGQGDLKLLVSVGLLGGAPQLFYALVVGAILAGVIVGILVFIRRLTLKSYVPYGPFLIVGTLWAILALPAP
jgi:prepilin signal peptidase PulO-like enzyme (type II secretory pathway)